MKTSLAIQEFLLSRGGLRPRTQKEYHNHLIQFEKVYPVLPETPQPIQAWLNSFNGLAPETVHSRFRTLRAFYKQVHVWHSKIKNPMPLVRPPRLLPKTMRTFADVELLRLFWQPLEDRDRALLMILVDIGPRATECANLTWDDVVPGFLLLRGKTGERTVPVSDATINQIEKLKPKRFSGRDHVFIGRWGPLKYEGIYKIVRRLCRESGITGKRCSPHTFRHTFGTSYAAAEGCDPKVLQDIMGHSDFKTTLRYIQNNPKRMAKNHERCSPLKAFTAAAQSSMFADRAEPKIVKEAEKILATKGG